MNLPANGFWVVIFLGLSIGSRKAAATPTSAQSVQREARVVGGSDINILDAPYMVSIRLSDPIMAIYGAGHICGGSIISQRAILTAATCVVTDTKVRQPSDFKVFMNSTYLYAYAFLPGSLEYDVLQINYHENFTLDPVTNDVALFFINGFIPWDASTPKAVALNRGAEMPGSRCLLAGFGTTNYTRWPRDLQGANVSIISNEVCALNYGPIPTSMICAGNMTDGGVDACMLDEGGPLVCNNLLTGIVSWGRGCGWPGYPWVYMNVSDYSGWIERANATFDYSYYVNGTDGGGDGAATMSGHWLLFVVMVLVSILGHVVQSKL